MRKIELDEFDLEVQVIQPKTSKISLQPIVEALTEQTYA